MPTACHSGPALERGKQRDYARKVIQTRRRGLVYPYALLPLLTRSGGTFVEYDLDGDRLVPVERETGGEVAGALGGAARASRCFAHAGCTAIWP